ncbi:tRNA glutamyl-Q(34) synthetase GluQRS [Kordiimonas sediminis]|uniref:tRNA glutamyl-Q(34) synthetase GluQRS n=1 Tax=Kordiimonas sediminis TaxID=1735581 RepID=A0A919AKA8_9PROT|nr:tRNA glutamyl-Q(34) synthetase GluQRS [Kordiimonas sediminis]GHF11641.1 tRNA glutamyl-Q(34) synthetase GluQRS [Kordiimonas sediminis]
MKNSTPKKQTASISPIGQPFITRFAPSPTGHLHKGHAYSAQLAHDRATAEGGTFLLRIEDIDTVRCRPEYTESIFEDLHWLGVSWPEPVRVQSEHFRTYAEALQKLRDAGLLYPCFCTRKDIMAAGDKTITGPDGPLYPGTCRHLPAPIGQDKIARGTPHAWRLDTYKALASLQAPLPDWIDEIHGRQKTDPLKFGDVILARKDTPTSYHISVVVDDALQNVSHVIRGMDLFEATHIHVLLQTLLGLPTPVYHHHPLLLEDDGKKFSKSNRSVTLRSLREAGYAPDEVLKTQP